MTDEQIEETGKDYGFWGRAAARLVTERNALRAENQRLTEQMVELRKDHERLNWLQDWLEKVKWDKLSTVRETIDEAAARP